MTTFKIQAIAKIAGSSLDGLTVTLWTGRTKQAAGKALARLESEHRAHYHSFEIAKATGEQAS